MPAVRKTPAPTWPTSVAVLLGLAFAFGGLTPVFSDSGWWFVSVGVAALVSVTIVGVRTITRFRWLPPLLGLVVLLVATTFTFAPGQGYLGFIPNLDTLSTFGQIIGAGAKSIAEQAVPANPVRGIVFMLTAGAGLLAIALDHTVQVLKRPALVGVPLLVILLVPTFFVGGEANPVYFVLTAGAYLFVLYLDLGEVRVGGAFAVGATAAAAALLLPLLLPPIAPAKSVDSGAGFAVGINTFITLGDSLRQPNISRVLTYSNPADEPQSLTVSIITNFNGVSWSPVAPTVNEENGLDSIGPTPGLGSDVETVELTTAVSIVNMGGHWVPVPYAPQRIDELEGNWTFDSDTLSVASPNLSVRGEQYVVTSQQANPTVEQLRAAGTVYGENLNFYLRVPEGLPEIVRQTAAEVVGDAATPYDQAVALQDYFLGGDFTYSEFAPVEQGYDGTSAEVVGRFLEAKSGYCVHFSSAMAVMARTLGIPSRIGIGFTPGELVTGTDDKPDFFAVTTANLHAWPELWFEGVGWVRFEPTPGRGFSPSFDSEQSDTPTVAPTSGPTVAPQDEPIVTATPTPTATDADPGFQSSAPDQTVPRIVVTVVIVAVIGFVLLPLVPIAVRQWRRRRRYWRVRRHGSAVDAWAELRDVATDLGWSTATLTPRQFAIGARRGMPEKVVRSLATLLTALEATAYSRYPSPSLLRDLTRVRRAMVKRATRRERARARFTPASVVFSRRRR